eukprot:comp8961_c0_seq1/m.4156 comp8961_c0_seq1/g.4156  ORF comp8961_c0_seq1/g.4156 comp8961_c0_seq1/m.4156 type:complete len:320 (+) comp8961_c0_seq1:1447-2406(+)
MLIALCKMVRHTALAGVQVTATQVLSTDDLTGGSTHQGGTGEENCALVADNDGLIGHGRHIGTTSSTRAHHYGNLWDAGSRHGSLVVENTTKVVPVGEHIGLVGQVGTARVHEVDAGQVVLHGHLLGPQVLLDGDWVVGASLDRGVVGYNHTLGPGDPADTGDDTTTRHIVGVELVAGHLGELEEGGVGIQQGVHSVSGQQLAPLDVPFNGLGTTTLLHGFDLVPQILNQCLHARVVVLVVVAAMVYAAGNDTGTILNTVEVTAECRDDHACLLPGNGPKGSRRMAQAKRGLDREHDCGDPVRVCAFMGSLCVVTTNSI